MTMTLLPAGASAVLVELADLDATIALLAALLADPIDGVGPPVPGARTLLLAYDPLRWTPAALQPELQRRARTDVARAPGALVDIPVHYDGEDLADVAALLGLSPAEVVRRHTGQEWFVAFTGFAPGFAYLSGGDPLLQRVPRRASPRTRIPPGAVAVAGGFSGVYPKASPGGWQILGQTFVPMWDLARDPPALLQPGQRVRFVDAGPRPATPDDADALRPAPRASTEPEPASAPGAGSSALIVRRTGLQALVQDLGRPGRAGQGLAASGAMDRRSLREAQRLVGNPVDAAALELLGGGFELESVGEQVVAVTGATGPLWLLPREGASWSLPTHAPVALGDGDRLRVGEPQTGLRRYLAVRGGLRVAPVLGSCAYDSLADVGPPPLVAGQRLGVGAAPATAVVAHAEPMPPAWPRAGDCVTLDVLPGPRDAWFTPEALGLLAAQDWTVTPQSNRIGLRLQGEQPLARARAGELPSEGTVRGAIQVPANGQPVLFLSDHPLTGGYPVIGCLAPHHLDLAGQLPVGTRLRFRRWTPATLPRAAT